MSTIEIAAARLAARLAKKWWKGAVDRARRREAKRAEKNKDIWRGL